MGEENDFWDRSSYHEGGLGQNDVSRLLSHARQCNAAYFTGKYKTWTPVIVCGQHCGYVTPEMKTVVKEYPQYFDVDEESVTLKSEYRSFDARSKAVGAFVDALKTRRRPGDPYYVAFDFWRNEFCDVWGSKHDFPLLRMERSCMCLLGFRNYAVILNGYVRHAERGMRVWFQRRALTKSTWPGKWDSLAGGGITSGHKVRESVIREAVEEASIPQELLESDMKPAWIVSFFHEDARGIFPNVYHVFDLELPPDVTPVPGDGEASEFQLLDAREALEFATSGQFKMTSGPVVVDFMVRHGIVCPDEEPLYTELIEHLHAPLHVPHGCFHSPSADGGDSRNAQ